MDERTVIECLGRVVGSPPSPAGIGDDAALLGAGARVVTVDHVVEGRHFSLEFSGFFEAGFRLFARNASDVFAMNSRPAEFLLGLVLPPHLSEAQLIEFAQGISVARDEIAPGAALIGGDTTFSAGPFVASLTMFGPAPQLLLRRDAAAAGQRLWLNGPLGRAAAGLSLLRAAASAGADEAESPPEAMRTRSTCVAWYQTPRPQPLELPQDCGATAAIDVSDGLVRDLYRLARASAVKIVLHCDPIGSQLPGVSSLSAFFGAEPAGEFALYGGDDYVVALFADSCPGEGWTEIGHAEAGEPAVHCQFGDQTAALADRGW
jgi:thiamine-monophosphate kinase